MATIVIDLPFPAGTSYKVTQGNKDTSTHSTTWTGKGGGSKGYMQYALDFNLRTNKVTAVCAGKVVKVVSDKKVGSSGWGNYVTIEHDIDGTKYYSLYAHFSQTLVNEDDEVGAGAVIGVSGNTGKSTGRHLHFQLQKSAGWSASVEVEYRYREGQGDDHTSEVETGVPEAGKYYTSVVATLQPPMGAGGKGGLKSLYAASERGKNYFPIAAYGWWHNGVHLAAPAGAEVHAVARGRIRYVCISRGVDDDHGSSNFVLIEHDLVLEGKKTRFYSLYMHLHPVKILREPGSSDAKKMPGWIRRKFYAETRKVQQEYEENGVWSLTIYAAPKSSAKHLQELQRGDEVSVLDDVSNSRWTRVRSSTDIEGWVWSAGLKSKEGTGDGGRYRLKPFFQSISKGQRREIFHRACALKEPVTVNAGETIGYCGVGLEHIAIKGHSIAASRLQPAHLLDLHVNRPAYVDNVALQAVQRFKGKYPHKSDTSAWTDHDEQQLVRIYLEIRHGFGATPMTHSRTRAEAINGRSLSTARNSYG